MCKEQIRKIEFVYIRFSPLRLTKLIQLLSFAFRCSFMADEMQKSSDQIISRDKCKMLIVCFIEINILA